MWYVLLVCGGAVVMAHLLTTYSMPGELTDTGRQTTLVFGKWLRRLYVDELKLVTSQCDGTVPW